MFMVGSSKEKSSFWARNRPFIDGVFKAGAIVVGLKVLKAVCDHFDQWLCIPYCTQDILFKQNKVVNIKNLSRTCIFKSKAWSSTGKKVEHSTQNYSSKVFSPLLKKLAAHSIKIKNLLLSKTQNKFRNYMKIHIRTQGGLLLFRGWGQV